jgi:hypothetical protein
MSTKPLNLGVEYDRDDAAKYIALTWFNFNSQRRTKIEEWKEVRDYVFATDTSTTSNAHLPWKNKTTLPKLCQIRDNLHSNYISALFPNDSWLKWEGYNSDSSTRDKVKAIEAYMTNKTRIGGFRTEISKMLYDFIDYGNAFGTYDFISSSVGEDEVKTIRFVGPKARRISPLDIVFNPLAASFEDSWKIVRSIKTLGELHAMALDEPENAYLIDALEKRKKVVSHVSMYGIEDDDKSDGFLADGFGSMQEYLQSGYVEVLDFYGDIFDVEGNLQRNRVVTVIDRCWVIRNDEIPNWMGTAPIFHVGWRTRPDNLWAMGPLDNLVGMQYRIDHLENIKADAMDLAILPPLKITGEVEEFVYRPGEEIHIDENGDVQELAKNAQWVIQSENQVQMLEQRMEMYAGAPREAMGIRTAGEKTAFEVQQLQNAAGRIFQEKISTFEMELMEKLLNGMLEASKRNLDEIDVVRSIDDDLGIEVFLELTKEDITASGVIRPIGARHFAAQAQLLQNLAGVYNTQIGQMIAPHTSSKRMAELVEDVLGLARYDLYRPNVAIFEQQETQRLVSQAQEDLMVEQEAPIQ